MQNSSLSSDFSQPPAGWTLPGRAFLKNIMVLVHHFNKNSIPQAPPEIPKQRVGSASFLVHLPSPCGNAPPLCSFQVGLMSWFCGLLSVFRIIASCSLLGAKDSMLQFCSQKRRANCSSQKALLFFFHFSFRGKDKTDWES